MRRRLVRASTGSLVAALVLCGSGCALELVPQGTAPLSTPRHGATDTWASEPSSRWTISIQPDTGEDEASSERVQVPSAAVIPDAAPVRSEPLAPAPAAPIATPSAQPEIHVATVTEIEEQGADLADASLGTESPLSRVATRAVTPAEPEAASRPAPVELPTYVSSRSAPAPGDDLTADDRDEPSAAASAPHVAAATQAPYVIEPPRRGGGEPRDPSDAASDDLLDPEYRIGVEDLLDVSLLGEPELQHVTMRVSPRGTIDFPFAGTLTAAGLSVDEFRNALIEKLDDYYVAPQVTVFLREYRSRMVHILGEVPRPGPFKLTHRNTLMEVLSRAGGFTPLANKSDVQIIRSDAAGKRIIRVDVNEIIDDGRIDLDIPLESGDVINVPERLF